MDKQNVRTLSLIVCCFTYLLVGAAVFDALESEFEVENNRTLTATERSIQEKYNISSEDLETMRKNVVKLVPYKAGTQWKFAGAFYFALTVITTIGYGHSTPQTVGGKIFCMFYATSGIPLCLVMFQSVGERLNIFITFVLQHLKKCFRMKNTEVSQSNLLLITLNFSTIVLTAGAAAFSYYEGWHYIDSFYYCFITFATIGFGDFVALQKDNMLTDRPDYVAFSLIFILIGLTVLSAAMNLLVLRFLTMNVVEDQCGDMEATAAITSIRLDDEVIPTNGAVVMAAQEQPEFADRISVCSCSCYNLRSGKFRRKSKLFKALRFSKKDGGVGGSYGGGVGGASSSSSYANPAAHHGGGGGGVNMNR
ncbi:two pore potassium channel protein sup-9-like [Babylonia areolata]|uniref:two pore potassium channel protein sup-9-like n=1 Tax=Babylonia areolata TaxID=304850 RepID=UPI003FD0F77B